MILSYWCEHPWGSQSTRRAINGLWYRLDTDSALIWSLVTISHPTGAKINNLLTTKLWIWRRVTRYVRAQSSPPAVSPNPWGVITLQKRNCTAILSSEHSLDITRTNWDTLCWKYYFNVMRGTDMFGQWPGCLGLGTRKQLESYWCMLVLRIAISTAVSGASIGEQAR